MVIIARGDEIRHFTVRPWVVALVGSAVAAVAIGYLLATTYLVLRDDLIGATVARQARMQQSYEDRISALRSQVDRITSRQLLDQQLMETKVAELLERQSQLYLRQGRLEPIVDRMGGDDEVEAEQQENPDRRAAAGSMSEKTARLALDLSKPVAASVAAKATAAFWPQRGAAGSTVTSADRADRLFVEISRSLRAIEDGQIARIASLAEDIDRKADTIAGTLEEVGISADRIEQATTGVGGPFIAVDDADMFETRMRELDEAVARLETVRKVAADVPIHTPAKGHAMSSSFGVRRDPFLGRPAMHAGIDFRATTGTPARAGGAGKVVRAGWSGGYGRMVEVEHNDGLTTRYAHLSKIDVKVGDTVKVGQIVGKVGSTGRSTGPHLHYEIRRNGTAINPLRFIKAGRKIAELL